jgi:hypothetical protein
VSLIEEWREKMPKRWVAALFVTVPGMFALLNSLNNPRFAALHGSDIVKLLAAGICFGVAIGILCAHRFFDEEAQP